jgi:AAT family amino acid transporter/D-serine/D-alanine/glycine transporter
MPFGKVMSWATLVFFVGILIALSLSKDTRIALFAAPVWILFMVIVYRSLRGTRATAEAIDFDAERIRARETLDREREAEEAKD